MKKHAYGNTVSDDLWGAVQEASGTPILDIAHDFTLQPGIPLITVESATCSGNTTTLKLKQGEFTRDRPNKQSLAWRVPVIAQSVGGQPVRTVVQGGAATLEVPGCAPVVLNAGQSGYYRTLYTPQHFATIRDKFTSLAPIDQLGLMNDIWALGMPRPTVGRWAWCSRSTRCGAGTWMRRRRRRRAAKCCSRISPGRSSRRCPRPRNAN